MTVFAYIECDETGCSARVEGLIAPNDWTAIVYGPIDDSFGLPASRHFCPEHFGSKENLAAIRMVTAARRANE